MPVLTLRPVLYLLPALLLTAALPGTALPPSGLPCALGPAPDGEILFEDGFSAGADDWTIQTNNPSRPNLWHWTTFAGNGSANDHMFHGDAGRIYYGIENAQGGTYNTHNRNQGEMRGPVVSLPAGGAYALAINTKWHVEFDRPLIIDSMVVGYALDGGQRVAYCYLGNAWAPVWNIPMGYGYYQVSPWGNAIFTGCEYAQESPQNPCRASEDLAGVKTAFDLAPVITLWEPRYAVLPANVAGHDLQVSFWFQTGDAIVDDAMGFMVDDVRVIRIG